MIYFIRQLKSHTKHRMIKQIIKRVNISLPINHRYSLNAIISAFETTENKISSHRELIAVSLNSDPTWRTKIVN